MTTEDDVRRICLARPWAGADPDTYFWTPRHDRSPRLVLVRLGSLAPDELDELPQDSYRIAGAPKTG